MEKGTEAALILKIDSKGRCSMSTEGALSVMQVFQLCFGAIHRAAEQTVDAAYNDLKERKDIKLPDGAKLEDYPQYVREQLADAINFGASNILNQFCPPDPDMQLSEVAIATMENEIINKAAKEGISIKDALEQYQKNLLDTSPYAVNLEKGKVLNMACKKKGKGKGKGGSC